MAALSSLVELVSLDYTGEDDDGDDADGIDDKDMLNMATGGGAAGSYILFLTVIQRA